MIEFRPLRADSPDFPLADRLNRASFPPDEYFSLSGQLELQEKGEFSVRAFYDDGIFAGFISFRHYRDIAYLCYLAVEETQRSRGVGSRVLEAARHAYADRQLVVDFEVLDPAAENYAQRVRRKRFYLRNGFSETGFGTEYFGVTYEICCANRPFDLTRFQEMMNSIRVPGFHPRYFVLKEEHPETCVRPAVPADGARLAEIEVFNYRLNFYPIFLSDEYYFGELTVPALMEGYRQDPSLIARTLVYDDGVVKGFLRLNGSEIEKLFVEPVLQGQSVGAALLRHAVQARGANTLWALEKNTRAIRFYERHGFRLTDDKKAEEDTAEFLVRMTLDKESDS